MQAFFGYCIRIVLVNVPISLNCSLTKAQQPLVELAEPLCQNNF